MKTYLHHMTSKEVAAAPRRCQVVILSVDSTDGWCKTAIQKSSAEKGETLFKLIPEHMTTWLDDFIAGETSVVEPRADGEGRPYPGVELDRWGNRIEKEDES